MLTLRAEQNTEKGLELNLWFCKLLLFMLCSYSLSQDSIHAHPGVNDGIANVL